MLSKFLLTSLGFTANTEEHSLKADGIASSHWECILSKMDFTDTRNMKVDGVLPHNAEHQPSPSQAEDLLACPEGFIPIRVLRRGAFNKVELAVERKTGARMVLKYNDKLRTRMMDYLREFQTSCRLIHHAIVTTYDQPIDTDAAFIIVQEYAARGDLLEAIPPRQGLDENRAKSVLGQIASALAFMHNRLLVHGNVKPENILIFDSNMTIIKLSDFKDSHRQGDTVKKRRDNVPYTAPEICPVVINESHTVDYGQDIWAFGVLVFCVLTGMFPWGTATLEDTSFRNFTQWHKRRVNLTPVEWRKLSPKMQKFLKKILDPNPERRCPVDDINKYMQWRWLESHQEQSSILEETRSCDAGVGIAAMKELRVMLESHGVQTCTDKKQRTDEWVQAACRQPNEGVMTH